MRQWKEKEEGKGRKGLRLVTQIALIAVTALFCVNYLGFQVKVEGRSMEPVVSQDSMVLVNRVSVCFFSPSRFDVIAFWQNDSSKKEKESETGDTSRIYVKYVVGLVNRVSVCFFSPSRFDVIAFWQNDSSKKEKESETGDTSRIYVKYVVGLPGETIQIKDGKIWIDGTVLNEEQYQYLDEISVAGLAQEPITLGEDEYFVLGANLSNSEDSRFASIGNVKREDIIGDVWFHYHSFTDMGFI